MYFHSLNLSISLQVVKSPDKEILSVGLGRKNLLVSHFITANWGALNCNMRKRSTRDEDTCSLGCPVGHHRYRMHVPITTQVAFP